MTTSTTLIFFVWLGFYALHSLLASGAVKRRFAHLGARYRLGYNLFALLLFALALYYSVGGEMLEFLDKDVVRWLGFIFLTLGLGVLFLAIRGYNLYEFSGLKEERDENQKLNTSGLNSWVRHPLYSGTLLFLFGYWFSLAPTNHFAALVVATCVYLPFGIRWEEAKLHKVFGEEWVLYKRRVKSIIPGIF